MTTLITGVIHFADMRQKAILWFWFPLFASWLLMTLEGPTISSVINRLPDEVIMLAAQGIVVGLSVTIESPIINMLATSTALSRDRASFLLIRRFTLHWMVLLTAVSILLAFTPLFDLVVRDLMAVPREVADWVQPGLQIMIFWSAAIGWRRFLQGIMIRFNHTRMVAWGTAVRLVASAGTVIALALLTDMPGVTLGAVALMAGVIAEAAYATYAARPIIAREFGDDAAAAESPLTYRALLRFHLPLAGTSLLVLLVQPMVAFSLARLPEPTLALAAWPLVFQFMLVARAPGFALPEAVIALSKGEETFAPLRKFTFLLVAANSLLMIVVVATPLAGLYLNGIQDATPEVSRLAHSGLLLFIPLPAFNTLVSWLRGLLIGRGETAVINVGMAINLGVTAALLVVGVLLQWPGINTAALALSVAAMVEFVYLWWRARSLLGFPIVFFERRREMAVG